jgi:hypothetical protein
MSDVTFRFFFFDTRIQTVAQGNFFKKYESRVTGNFSQITIRKHVVED